MGSWLAIGRLRLSPVALCAVLLCVNSEVALGGCTDSPCGPAVTPENRYALVIGVSDYPAPIDPLQGPRNDVSALVQALTRRHWIDRSHIRVLADHPERSFYSPKLMVEGQPTLQEILAGLDWLARTVRPGDEALIYLSGHGSYLPERDKPGGRTEPDGYDEIFLPLDIQGWEDGKGVQNALLDDDLGVRIGAIRAAGAFVWLVVDACHSGTLSRGGYQTRTVDPVHQLGVPAAQFTRAGQRGSAEHRQPAVVDEHSDFVGFYATLPSLDEIEGLFPRGGPPAELRAHGLLTWYLVRALEIGEAGSYANLARAIIAGESTWGADAPLPMFEGELRRSTGFGIAGGRLYSLHPRGASIVVDAGLLDDVSLRSQFDILDLRKDPPTVVGSGTVTGALANQSVLDLLVADGPFRARLPIDLTARVHSNPGAFGARIATRVMPYVLQVHSAAVGRNANLTDRQLARKIHSALNAVLSWPADRQGVPVELSPDAATADVDIHIQDGRVWYLTSAGAWVPEGGRQPFSQASAEVSARNVNRALRMIAHGRNLLRAARSLQESALASSIHVTVRIQSQPAIVGGSCPPHTQGAVIPTTSRSVFDSISHSTGGLIVRDCDRVFITVTNQGRRPVDLTPLYMDHWMQVSFLSDYFESTYGPLRLRPGESRVVSYTEHTSQARQVTPTGPGHLLLLGSEADESASMTADYRYLATDELEGPLRDGSARRRASDIRASRAFAVMLDFITQ